MKKIICLIISLIIILPSTIYAATNPYSHYSTVPGTTDKMVNCTWYAWQQAYEKMGVELASMGNAKNWYSKAKSLGYSVGTTPKVNSIAVYSGGSYGHVAYVVSVDGEVMTVNEGGIYMYESVFDDDGNYVSTRAYAYNTTGIYEGALSTSVVGNNRYDGIKISNNEDVLTGFIYLDSVPTITTTTTTKKTTTSTSTSTIELTTEETTTITTESTTTTISTTETTTIKDTTEINDKSDKEKINIESIALIVTSIIVVLTILIIFIFKKKK